MVYYTFTKFINTDKLINEIALAGFNTFSYISTAQETVYIYFSEALNEEQQLNLTNLITAHINSPLLVDVTPRQIRQALILSGVQLSQIEGAIDAMAEPTRSLAKAEWEYSNAFERNRPLVIQVGTVLGWTAEQLDNLWILAATL